MRGNRHQTTPSKPGSSGSLAGPGLRRNDTGSGGAAAPRATTPAVSREAEDASDWTTAGGIPVVLLWLPYTALTALLLGLMLASFIRFHRKRLRKFRSRKEQLWRQLDVQEFLEEQRREEAPPNGNLLPPPTAAILPPTATATPIGNCRQTTGNGRRKNASPPGALHTRCNDHADRKASLEVSSRVGSDRQVSRRAAGERHRTTDETPRRRKRSPPEVTRHPHARRAPPAPPTGTGNAAPRKRSSVVFITNINGSMVNLRCGEPDALDPFQGRRCFWTVGDRDRASLTAPRSPVRASRVETPPCLQHPPQVARPAVWTTAFSYDPDMEYERRKTRYYD